MSGAAGTVSSGTMGSVTGIARPDPLGRERQHLAGQRYGDHGHADTRRAVAQRLVPEVVQNVVAEVIGEGAAAHGGHG